MSAMNPHAVRIAVREAIYPNHVIEDEVTRSVDRQVFERVRAHERHLVSQADSHLAKSRVDTQATTEIIDRLKHEVRFVLEEGGSADGDLADRYEQLRELADRALRSLERADQEAGWMQDRVAQPYEAYIALVEKWPTLRPTLEF